jgi:hypothetical protein
MQLAVRWPGIPNEASIAHFEKVRNAFAMLTAALPK